MQVKVIGIPVSGSEAMEEILNTFLRTHKIIQVEQRLVQEQQGSVWSFCIRYVEGGVAPGAAKEKIDYRTVLDDASFQRFRGLRDLRNKLAAEEGVSPYIVFTDAELAEMAKLEAITEAGMKAIKGIGDKKVEKYGKHFVNANTTATNAPGE
ncbi:MAG: HRDC domain-containing protein [Saprospiraceae bacterium]|nr:HRDC domain-containing protein [Saprospiraceae bacterium]